MAAELARGLLRELAAAEEKIAAAVSGRAGIFRLTATPVWMQAVIAPAAARFRERLPGVGLALRTAPLAKGRLLLADGESDLHCGGTDPGAPLPAFLRRERFLDLTAGIAAHDGRPLLERRPAVRELAEFPWIDFGAPVPAAPTSIPPAAGPPSLDRLLDRLVRQRLEESLTIREKGLISICVMDVSVPPQQRRSQAAAQVAG